MRFKVANYSRLEIRLDTLHIYIEIYIEIDFMFMILCNNYVARAYTLASTVGAIVQYCLRNLENPHISVRL